MVRADKILESMRGNPLDRRIEDVITVCAKCGIECSPPRNGSHYKVRHPAMIEILTIPAHRPIKPVYIRHLVRFIDVVIGEGA